jgi:eukaryotic-like serine/threonine-protein kinase
MNAQELEDQTLGKYQILRKLGEGNMALVYLAKDPFIDRLVAVKVAHPGRVAAADDPAAFKQMFFNEAQTAGMLRHPSITAIFDAGMDQDIYYIVMEYVQDGLTLEQFTSVQSLVPLEDVTNILYQCAQALDYAHRRGVIHRDIKPRNILITPAREVKITDFGVAVVQAKGSERLTEQAGSPLYMSPEQIQNEPLTGQSDLFSLGIVAYELLTGKHPFAGNNLEAIHHQILTKKPAPLLDFRANTPEVFQRIVDKALAKAPYYRYKSGADLAGDIALVFDFLKRAPNDISPQEKFSKVRSLRFFAEFPELELWEIVNAAEWSKLPAGHEIVHEGEIDPTFYVIVEGTVAVLKGTRNIIQLRAGDCFGEMALLSGRKRSATIVADSAVTVVKLRGTVIDRTSVNCQLRFQRNFLTALIERLELATEQITGNTEPPAVKQA